MTFKMTPGRDWVEQINRFMDDYNGFSNGWQDAGKRDDSTKRWGMKRITDGFVGINGTTIEQCDIQQYTWNNQMINFFVFHVNTPAIKNMTSREIIQLPVNYYFGVGFVDTLGSNGYLRIQGANTDKLNVVNDSGVDVSTDIWGEVILL